MLFLQGRVATSDGTPVPNNVLVERVCNNNVRQQVYAAPRGDFSMQLGSRTNSVLDASGGGGVESPYAMGRTVDRVDRTVADQGIPRRELANCELRASASGFYSSPVSLASLDPLDTSSIDVGAIVVERLGKIESMTLDAAPYNIPRDARIAYEKGLKAEKERKFADALRYFEKATAIYPRYARAWFQLGTVLRIENQRDAARRAYTQATAINTKFPPPYMSLALMAYEAEDWTEVLHLTDHILDLDPLNYTHVSGYVLDLDGFDYAGAYYYNALANYKLGRIERAEKSALKAQFLDMWPRFPQVHLLLAEIFAKNNNYASAISEMRIYLGFVADAKERAQLQEQLAKLEKLNALTPATAKTDQK